MRNLKEKKKIPNYLTLPCTEMLIWQEFEQHNKLANDFRKIELIFERLLLN